MRFDQHDIVLGELRDSVAAVLDRQSVEHRARTRHSQQPETALETNGRKAKPEESTGPVKSIQSLAQGSDLQVQSETSDRTSLEKRHSTELDDPELHVPGQVGFPEREVMQEAREVEVEVDASRTSKARTSAITGLMCSDDGSPETDIDASMRFGVNARWNVIET